VASNTDSNRVKIEYDLTFQTLFHCGTGIRSGLIDRTVVRDGQGYLYVPGTTFKGILRKQCEQVARLFTEEHYINPHDPEAALLDGLRPQSKRQPTLITRIFGSQNSPGRLFFDDLRQEDLKRYDGRNSKDRDSEDRDSKGRYKRLQVDEYTQVRLDRSTRTAVPGALYTSEFGTREMTFKGVIQGWVNCATIDPGFFVEDKEEKWTPSVEMTPTYSLLLLLAGLGMIEHIGGNQSTGKGKCCCTITSFSLNGQIETHWRSWLKQLEVLAYYDMIEEG
jgi:CRISPR/Cas system CMR subunit Cmr4 (Cas7 group RAMP superfamily)